MSASEVTALGLLVIAFALVSRRSERLAITMPMVFVGAGVLAEATGVVELGAERSSIAVLAEVTLAVLLFSDASRIEFRRLRTELGLPIRLLAVGLPLTIALGTAVNWVLFPELPIAQVALIAAILAPTDAALGSAVVENSAVPIRERLALNVESGVNDGLVVPVVAILTAVVIGEQRSGGAWVGFIAQQIGLGAAVGVGLGVGAVALLRWAHGAGWSSGREEQLATFAVPVVALFAGEVLSANSFIAAFVAGLVFGSWHRPNESNSDVSAAHFGEFTEDAAQLLAMLAFFAFGNVLVVPAFEHVTVPVVLCAALALTVGRIGPVWISLLGTSLRPPTRLFLGWFGPRGLASIVFGLVLWEDLESIVDSGETLFSVIALTVVASVVLHGVSAWPGATRYAAWAAQGNGDQSPDMAPDMVPPRPRWSR